MRTIQIDLNGQPTELSVHAHETLLRVLRREGLFSVKYGSDTGETGAAAL